MATPSSISRASNDKAPKQTWRDEPAPFLGSKCRRKGVFLQLQRGVERASPASWRSPLERRDGPLARVASFHSVTPLKGLKSLLCEFGFARDDGYISPIGCGLFVACFILAIKRRTKLHNRNRCAVRKRNSDTVMPPFIPHNLETPF